MKRDQNEKELIVRRGGTLFGWLFGKPIIIINADGISCTDWPFTFIPWEHIAEVGVGSATIHAVE